MEKSEAREACLPSFPTIPMPMFACAGYPAVNMSIPWASDDDVFGTVSPEGVVTTVYADVNSK